MDWEYKISGCFGESDLIFAGHPNDEDRAFGLLTELREQAIGWAEFSSAVVKFLESENASKEHLDQQMNKVQRFCRAWLLD